MDPRLVSWHREIVRQALAHRPRRHDAGSSLHAAERRIEDYDATAGGTRDRADDTNHAQPGDPAKAAAAILTIAAADDPPTRLQLGADCVARVEGKLAHVAGELSTWRALSVSTDHDDVVAA
ncbi:MAG TPA: hypothetical protein VGM33_09080 [Baekduia sp.]|jgi:hypothetical protein